MQINKLRPPCTDDSMPGAANSAGLLRYLLLPFSPEAVTMVPTMTAPQLRQLRALIWRQNLVKRRTCLGLDRDSLCGCISDCRCVLIDCGGVVILDRLLQVLVRRLRVAA